jgi:hypothetical protein
MWDSCGNHSMDSKMQILTAETRVSARPAVLGDPEWNLRGEMRRHSFERLSCACILKPLLDGISPSRWTGNQPCRCCQFASFPPQLGYTLHWAAPSKVSQTQYFLHTVLWASEPVNYRSVSRHLQLANFAGCTRYVPGSLPG